MTDISDDADEHDRDDDDETFQEWRRRYNRGILTSVASMVILLGIFAIVAPWLPANSPEQAAADPVVYGLVGLAMVVAGSVWLARIVRRHGFHPRS